MRVLIADDEAPARRLLARLLGTLGVAVVAEAESGEAALDAAFRTKPDVILLDIHMPEMDGLELAARYAHLPPIVFVTADDAHALRAFEVGAIDYLLKPVRVERLAEALERAAIRAANEPVSFPARESREQRPPRVVTHDRGATRFFDARAIARFQASEKYTVFWAEGEEHVTDEPLVALEARLAPHGFVRAHRSELIRVAAVRALTQDAGSYRAHLVDGQVVEVSRRLVASVKEALGLA
jgi:two-component system LytT family response regulator